MGSLGLIHKGLDLLLEIFKELPDYNLYICGSIKNEPEFEHCYFDELYRTKNIHTYGFIGVDSFEFREIIKKCNFIIFPSCSEGQASSVINAMVYGLIPIVTISSGINIKDFGIEIETISHNKIKEAILKAISLSQNEIKEMSMRCALDTIKNHSIEKFSEEFKKSLLEILKQNGLKI